MTLLTISPTASEHDAREASGTVTLTGHMVLTGGLMWAGLFLPSVAYPTTGATLLSSYLYYKSRDAARDDPDLTWYMQGTNTASVFTTAASSISSRTRTTASVADTATGIGTTNYRQVDITTLVAEVLLVPGWTSGNNMVLIGDCGGSVALEFSTFDTGTNLWYVEINYSEGSIPILMDYYSQLH